ncbi:hypothetical protein JTE90_012185 [Oedothorax gibbosus]|uniref:Major facilitator superfamily (MFS) profile domain-containing protein n=1 Tax=Oedothorax gibbosus TaxID=931172 RepID=A0AAV6VCJ8_9ARAC|nr:hypothetical protein JTE90_012185 [Oedothorax gibbosus]
MPSVFQLPYIIVLELVGPSMRTRIFNGIFNVSWTIGLSVLPLIASREWVTFGLATSSVSVLMFFYWKFLPESPRWLIIREKYSEATTVLTRIAEMNGKSQDPAELRIKIKDC